MSSHSGHWTWFPSFAGSASSGSRCYTIGGPYFFTPDDKFAILLSEWITQFGLIRKFIWTSPDKRIFFATGMDSASSLHIVRPLYQTSSYLLTQKRPIGCRTLFSTFSFSVSEISCFGTSSICSVNSNTLLSPGGAAGTLAVLLDSKADPFYMKGVLHCSMPVHSVLPQWLERGWDSCSSAHRQQTLIRFFPTSFIIHH